MHPRLRHRPRVLLTALALSSCAGDDEPAPEPVEVHVHAQSDASLLWASGHLQAEARLDVSESWW